jgi:uncharacterized protein
MLAQSSFSGLSRESAVIEGIGTDRGPDDAGIGHSDEPRQILGTSPRMTARALQPYLLTLDLRADLRDPANWTDAERRAVGAHFEMLRCEAAAGRVLLAGRSDEHLANGHMREDVIGIGVFLAETREEAEQFVAADPAVVAGVMKVTLHKFRLAVHAEPAIWAAL